AALTDPSPRTWLLLVLMAALSTYLAYFVYYTGLKRVEASRAVLVATIEPVVAAVLAAWLFGERLGALGIVGGALIVGAAMLSALPRRVFGRRSPVGSRVVRR
ncbi:MAG: DMT family transporter, partial [Trueperaceae bacterium]|nr:DMT family transporter [Trueperaceae bacterium]